MNRLALLGIWLLCQVAHVVSSTWMLAAIITGSERAWRLAVAYDQLANTATGGSEDETISSRANRAMLKGQKWGCVLCKLLDRFEKNHCAKSAGD